MGKKTSTSTYSALVDLTYPIFSFQGIKSTIGIVEEKNTLINSVIREESTTGEQTRGGDGEVTENDDSDDRGLGLPDRDVFRPRKRRPR